MGSTLPTSDVPVVTGSTPESSNGAESISPGFAAGTPDAAPFAASLEVYLGDDTMQRSRVAWELSNKANPHLMLSALPHIGKTTFLISVEYFTGAGNTGRRRKLPRLCA